MIVILIIGILMSIAVPNFLHARQNSRQNVVLANLRQIEWAKDRCSLDQAAAVGDSTKCTSATLVPSYIKVWPNNSPVSGTYVEGPVGTAPTFNGKDYASWQSDPNGL